MSSDKPVLLTFDVNGEVEISAVESKIPHYTHVKVNGHLITSAKQDKAIVDAIGVKNLLQHVDGAELLEGLTINDIVDIIQNKLDHTELCILRNSLNGIIEDD